MDMPVHYDYFYVRNQQFYCLHRFKKEQFKHGCCVRRFQTDVDGLARRLMFENKICDRCVRTKHTL